MNELRVFSNTEFGELRVLTIDGKDYFPATACARTLGYQDTINAIKQHCRWVVKHHVPHPQNPEKMIEMNFIPEGDLYRLIVSSRLPAAEKFERWVFDEVLPAIRRQGGYGDVAAIVTQAVQATVGEMIKQLLPLIQQQAQDPTPIRRKRHIASLCGALDAEIRQEIEDMIVSRRYTYSEISEQLWKRYGVAVSKSSIGRYATRLYDRIDGIML